MQNHPDSSDDWNFLWNEFHQALAKNPGRQYRYGRIAEEIGNIGINESLFIVDYGCGTGEFISFISSEFPNSKCFGLDSSKSAIKIAQEKFPDFSFQLLDLRDCATNFLQYSGADIVVCSEVIEHLDLPEVALRYMFKILAEEGSLIVTVPAGPMSHLEKYLGHKKHFTNKMLIQLLKDCGFSKVRVWRSGFPGINVIRLLSIVRGKRIIKDMTNLKSKSFVYGVAERILELLLSVSLKDSKFGWQLIAVAQK